MTDLLARLRGVVTLAYLKAHIALVGGLLTWYLAHYPSGPAVHYVALAVGVLTALGVATATNSDETQVLDDANDMVQHVFPDAEPEPRADLLVTDQAVANPPEGVTPTPTA